MRSSAFDGTQPVLLRNRGDGTFAKSAIPVGLSAVSSCRAVDWNGDGVDTGRHLVAPDVHRADGRVDEIASKATTIVSRGDRLIVETAGGGVTDSEAPSLKRAREYQPATKAGAPPGEPTPDAPRNTPVRSPRVGLHMGSSSRNRRQRGERAEQAALPRRPDQFLRQRRRLRARPGPARLGQDVARTARPRRPSRQRRHLGERHLVVQPDQPPRQERLLTPLLELPRQPRRPAQRQRSAGPALARPARHLAR